MGQLKTFPSAGHHDNDPGAVWKGRIERDENKKMRDAFMKHAKALGVDLSAGDKDSETNSQYQSRIKTGSGSVVVDFHLDAAPSNLNRNGTSVFIRNDATATTVQAAAELARDLSAALATVNLGVKYEKDSQHKRIGILHGPGIRVLVEGIFITNDQDWERWTKNYDAAALAAAKWAKKWDDKY